MRIDERLDPEVEGWVYGGCYMMALAMTRRLGWEVEALVVDVPGGTGLHLVHVWCVDPDGCPHDARGSCDAGCLHDDFLATTGRRWSNARHERFADERAYLARLEQACGERWWVSFRDECLEPVSIRAGAYLEEHFVPRHVGQAPSP